MQGRTNYRTLVKAFFNHKNEIYKLSNKYEKLILMEDFKILVKDFKMTVGNSNLSQLLDTFALYTLTTAQCCLFIPYKNIRKLLDFLMFSGGIDEQHHSVMG